MKEGYNENYTKCKPKMNGYIIRRFIPLRQLINIKISFIFKKIILRFMARSIVCEFKSTGT